MISKEIKYSLHYDDVRGDFTATTWHNTSYSRVKSQKGLPLETKNTPNHENWRLGLIESLHMQHCSMQGCIYPLVPA